MHVNKQLRTIGDGRSPRHTTCSVVHTHRANLNFADRALLCKCKNRQNRSVVESSEIRFFYFSAAKSLSRRLGGRLRRTGDVFPDANERVATRWTESTPNNSLAVGLHQHRVVPFKEILEVAVELEHLSERFKDALVQQLAPHRTQMQTLNGLRSRAGRVLEHADECNDWLDRTCQAVIETQALNSTPTTFVRLHDHGYDASIWLQDLKTRQVGACRQCSTEKIGGDFSIDAVYVAPSINTE